jgi:hypothetical protein
MMEEDRERRKRRWRREESIPPGSSMSNTSLAFHKSEDSKSGVHILSNGQWQNKINFSFLCFARSIIYTNISLSDLLYSSLFLIFVFLVPFAANLFVLFRILRSSCPSLALCFLLHIPNNLLISITYSICIKNTCEEKVQKYRRYVPKLQCVKNYLS